MAQLIILCTYGCLAHGALGVLEGPCRDRALSVRRGYGRKSPEALGSTSLRSSLAMFLVRSDTVASWGKKSARAGPHGTHGFVTSLPSSLS